MGLSLQSWVSVRQPRSTGGRHLLELVVFTATAAGRTDGEDVGPLLAAVALPWVRANFTVPAEEWLGGCRLMKGCLGDTVRASLMTQKMGQGEGGVQ